MARVALSLKDKQDLGCPLSLDETTAVTGRSRSSLYVDIAAGKIRIFKEGKRTFIPADEVRRLMARGTQAEGPA